MKKRKIMILTAPFGNGHVSVANEIAKEIRKQDDLEVILYDLFSEEFARTSVLLERFHIMQYKRGIAQQTYKYFYYNSDRLLESWIAKRYNNFGSKQLRKKIELEQPDAIINTFPVNSSYYLNRFGIDIPVYSVITDYFANANWINKSIKRHFVSSENVTGQLMKRNISEAQYEVTGIPVKEVFYQVKTEEEITALKEAYAIPKGNKVVLLVAGAKGVVPKFKTIIRLLLNNKNVTLLIICGNNKKLYNSITSKFPESDHIKIFGYVNNIYDMMFASDLMVTKPGGITITEASHIGLPVILFNPIFGQELENAIYFTARLGAKIAYNENEVAQQVNEILSDEVLLTQMKKNIKKIGYNHSAKLILDSILSDIKGEIHANQEHNQTT